MSDRNPHVRAAHAHLRSAASAPTFVEDTMRGLLVEIERLRAIISESEEAFLRGMDLAGVSELAQGAVMGAYSTRMKEISNKCRPEGSHD